jgi:hypothetical protein
MSDAAIPIHVPPQANGFAPKPVTISATYAGMTKNCVINVVRPVDMFINLIVDVKPTADPCRDVFAEGESLTLQIKNLNVLGATAGLRFSWTVPDAQFTGASSEEIVITSLPPAGTLVTIDVTVTNTSDARGVGHMQFTTRARRNDLASLERQVKCQVRHFQQLNAFLPPWIAVSTRSLTLEELTTIEEQATRLDSSVKQLVASVKELQRMRAKQAASSGG